MGPLGPERDDLIDVTISGQFKELDFRTRGVVFKDDEVDLEDFEISLEVKKTRVRKKARANKKLRLFASCCSQRKCRDIDLCCIEICLVITIALLLTQVGSVSFNITLNVFLFLFLFFSFLSFLFLLL